MNNLSIPNSLYATYRRFGNTVATIFYNEEPVTKMVDLIKEYKNKFEKEEKEFAELLIKCVMF